MTLYLTEADVDGLLTIEDAIEAVEGLFARLAVGAVNNRPRHRHRLEGGVMAVMSAVDHELGRGGVKAYAALSPERMSFVVTLFDRRGAEVEAVIEAEQARAAADRCRERSSGQAPGQGGATTLGILGCGWQAESQVAAIREAVPTIEKVVAYCRTEKSLKKFCKVTARAGGDSSRPRQSQDIVVTATTSADPVLRGEWLQPGALVWRRDRRRGAPGAGQPGARARRLRLLRLAGAVAGSNPATSSTRRQGVLDWLEVHELQEVMAGELAGRQSDEDIVLFKSNGLAAWDIAIGAAAWTAPASGASARASSRGLGERGLRLLRRVVADRTDDLGPSRSRWRWLGVVRLIR